MRVKQSMPSEDLTNDSIIVTEEEARERLDKILAARFREVYSRTYFQYLIDEQLVLLNGLPVKKRMKPQTGDEIEVHFAALPEISLAAENIPLSILYEDEDIIVVNKPAGMVVHPAPGNWSGTFVNALLFHCVQLEGADDSIRPGIVHRLDKDTSGVLVAAKTLDMQQKLTALFASRQVYKEYVAVCVGRPPDGNIEAPIGRHPIHRKQMAVVPTGRHALSTCKTLKWDGKLSVVQIVIATGRTHQIRVHLKHQGYPILGDSLYGNPSMNARYHALRQLLHARIVRFIHPRTGNTIELEAPLPEDIQQFFEEKKGI